MVIREGLEDSNIVSGKRARTARVTYVKCCLLCFLKLMLLASGAYAFPAEFGCCSVSNAPFFSCPRLLTCFDSYLSQ